MKDIVIIGGGIVGLSTAWKLKKKRPELSVLIIEKEKELAQHQTGHNSGVIHSGIYYKPGSAKATNCIQGYHEIINFAKEYGISYDLCGKVIVATDKKELAPMENIYQRGIENGLKGIKKIEAAEIKEIEPHCAGIAGIKVPQTGIIDYPGMCEVLGNLFQEAGGEIQLGEKVKSIQRKGNITIIETNKSSIDCKIVVNCAGLQSDKVASLNEPNLRVKIIPFRGEYYEIKKERQHLVKHLIYPVPDPNFPFLGVHFTRMIKGGVEAGPNAVLAFKREGYKKTDFNLGDTLETFAWPGFRKVAAKYWKTGLGEMYRSFSKAAFTKALQRLIPEIQAHDLIPGGAGIRAQACEKDGGLLDDFSIVENEWMVNILNAPSPAATSSLSIGEQVANMALHRF